MTNIKEVKIENLTHIFDKFDNASLGLYGTTYVLEDLCKHYISVKKRDVSYEIKVIEKLQIPEELKQQEIDRVVKESRIRLSDEEKKTLAQKITILMDILGMPSVESDTISNEVIAVILEKLKIKRSELKTALIEEAYTNHVK